MDVTDLKEELLLLRMENAELRRTASSDAEGQGEIMNQRQEIIERLRALELSGGSHEMLSAICRAVAPGAQFGWTQGACDGLRLRLISFLSETDEEALREAYTKGCNDGFDRGFASADDWCAQHEDAMAEHGWVRLPKDADGVPIRVGDELAGYGYPNGGAYCKAIVGEWGILAGEQECNYQRWLLWSAYDVRHHHAPTVEDVLRDMHAKLDEVTALYVGEAIDSDERDSDEARIFAEYAAKLQLRGDA